MTGPFNNNPIDPNSGNQQAAGQPPFQQDQNQQFGAPQQFPNQQMGGSPFVPKKKRAKWPWIVGGIFLFLLLLGGGCAFFFYKLVSGPTNAANEYYAELQDGDYVGAHDLLCENAKAALTPADLEAQYPNVSEPSFIASELLDDSASVEGEITINGVKRTESLDLVKVLDVWKPCPR